MFPNVRLLIVAVVAAVGALSAGFAVFAAFRVNHEPLARLPPVTAPVQLAADNPAPTSVTIGTETFGSRFQFSPPKIGADDADHTDSIAQTAKSPPAPAAEPMKQMATKDEPEATAPLSSPPEVKPSAQDTQASDAASDSPQDGAATVAIAPLIDRPQPAEQAVPTQQEANNEDVAAPATGTATQNAPEVAVQTAPDVAELAAPEVEEESVPAAEVKPPFETKAKARAAGPKRIATKAAKVVHRPVRVVEVRQYVAAKSHRLRRSRARAFAFSEPTDPTSMFLAPHFQSAPMAFQAQPLRTRRSARNAASTNTAVGGPFISVPGN